MMPKLDDFQFNNFEMNDKNNNNNFQLHLIVNNLSKYLVHIKTKNKLKSLKVAK